MILYAGAFTASAGLCWALTPVALRMAMQRGFLDRPTGYKAQPGPVPYLGGAAIVVAFSIAVVGGAVVVRPGAGFQEFPLVILLAVTLSVMGLADDLRGLNVLVRLSLEAAAAAIVFVAGTQVSLFDIPLIDGILTILWIVGVTNAFNLLDNMDGLSGGVAAIASAAFFLIAAANGQFLVAALSIALTGCALGFLRHNIHPAKIYMGDSGSLFLGFLLAVIGVKLQFDSPVQVTFMVPILVLGIPLFDTALVIATRLLNRLNPLSGGRDHTSHRLVFVGLSVRGAVRLIYGIGIALAWIALVMSRIDTATAMLLMGLVAVVALLFGTVLALVPIYSHDKRAWIMLRRVEPHEDPADLKQPGAAAPATSFDAQQTAREAG